MGIVVADLLAIAVIWLIVWQVLVSVTAKNERARIVAEQLASHERERRLRLDKQRYSTADKLRCLRCDHLFDGPLTTDGCPECHQESLVITEAEFQQRQAISLEN